MVEFLAFNQGVEGSSPSGGTLELKINASVAQLAEQRPLKAKVAGSWPAGGTGKEWR